MVAIVGPGRPGSCSRRRAVRPAPCAGEREDLGGEPGARRVVGHDRVGDDVRSPERLDRRRERPRRPCRARTRRRARRSSRATPSALASWPSETSIRSAGPLSACAADDAGRPPRPAPRRARAAASASRMPRHGEDRADRDDRVRRRDDDRLGRRRAPPRPRRRPSPRRSRRSGPRGPRAPGGDGRSTPGTRASRRRCGPRSGPARRPSAGSWRRRPSARWRSSATSVGRSPRAAAPSGRCAWRGRGRRAGTTSPRRSRSSMLGDRATSRRAMPQPCSRSSSPASVYMTVSWSGQTSSPWRSRSSPVLTTTVSSAPTTAWRPWASLAPADAAGQDDDGHPADAPRVPATSASTDGMASSARGPRRCGRCVSAVVRRGQADDDVPEAEVDVRPEARRRSPPAGREARARSSPRRRRRRRCWRAAIEAISASDRSVADDDREADRAFDRGGVAADRRAVLAQDRIAGGDLLDRPGRVPGVPGAGHRAERLLRPGATDEDRQVGLDRPGQERGSCSVVGRSVVVDRSPSSRRRMIATDSSSRSRRSPNPAPKSIPNASCSRSNQAPPMPRTARPSLMWSRVVASLAVRPGLRNVFAPTIRPSRTGRRHRGPGREGQPALEDRLAPRALDGQEVVPRPERVPAGRLRREGGVAEARPVGGLRPQLGAEPGAHRSTITRSSRKRKVTRCWRWNRSRMRSSASSGSSAW